MDRLMSSSATAPWMPGTFSTGLHLHHSSAISSEHPQADLSARTRHSSSATTSQCGSPWEGLTEPKCFQSRRETDFLTWLQTQLNFLCARQLQTQTNVNCPLILR